MVSKVDFGEIAERHSEDLRGKKLNEVVTVTLSATSLDSKQTTHYNLSPEVQEMAQNAYLLKDSHIFQIFWAEAAQELSESEKNLERDKFQPEEVYECLYCPSFKRFTKLYQDLKSGEVTFGEIDDIFKDFVNNYSILTKDLQTMCALYPRDQKDWIKERVQQIKEYHHLHQAVDSAKVIWKVKENLGLTGDFSVLHTLLSFVSHLLGTPEIGGEAGGRSQISGFEKLGKMISQLPSGFLYFIQCLNMPRALFLPLFTSSVTASVSFRSLVGGTIGIVSIVLGGPGASFSPHTALSCRLSFTAFSDDFLRLSWTTFATKNWTVSTSELSMSKSFCRISMRLSVSVWRSSPRERSSLVGSRRLSEVQSITLVARRLESI